MTKNPDAEKAKAARLEPIGVTPNRRAAHQAPRAPQSVCRSRLAT